MVNSDWDDFGYKAKVARLTLPPTRAGSAQTDCQAIARSCFAVAPERGAQDHNFATGSTRWLSKFCYRNARKVRAMILKSRTGACFKSFVWRLLVTAV